MMKIRNRINEAGFTIVEFTVAAFTFSIVLLVVLAMYEMGQTSTAKGERAADLQQNTRVGFDRMIDELRMVGFDYDRDGARTPYPNASDEAVEFLHDHAITIRTNLDHADGNGGRESTLETPSSDPLFGSICCPIVTIGNDEIITYALVSENTAANTDSISIRVDTSTIRNAYESASGAPVGEETLTISGVDLSMDNPPYRLYRYVVNQTGDGFIATRMADNIRSLTFTYSDNGERDFYCTAPDPTLVGGCAESNRIPFGSILGGDMLPSGSTDPIGGRVAREMVRAIDVELIGMETVSTPGFKDPHADPQDTADMAVADFKKFRLFSTITPPNLGKTGEPDLSSRVPAPPTDVTVCPGQCDAIRVEWDEPGGAAKFKVELFDANDPTTPPVPFLTQVVGGTEVEGSDPLRLWAAFSAAQFPSVSRGMTVYAVVKAMNVKDAESPGSIPSPEVLIDDLVRPEAPLWAGVTGYDPQHESYPDVSVMNVISDPNHTFFPRENEILVLWDAPRYALDVTDQEDPSGTAVTAVAPGETWAALQCDALPVDLDGDTVSDHDRTPLRELYGSRQYLIFRSEDPHFIPGPDNFIAATQGQPHAPTGKLYWVDRTSHLWADDGSWLRTRNALPCCTTWYYRIRAADACWSGSYPESLYDPHLSPFYPPLNPDNADNTDDLSNLAPEMVGLALPGYSIPSSKPGRATELRYHDLWDDGAKFTFNLRFRAPKMDTTLDAAGNPAPVDSAYNHYVLVSHPEDPYYLPNIDGTQKVGGQLDARIRVTDLHAEVIDRDDENLDGYIQPWEDETHNGPDDPTDLLIRIPNDSTRYYRLIPVQCENDSIAGTENNYYAYDLGLASKAVKLPCVFGQGENRENPPGYAWIDTLMWPDSVTVYTNIYADGVSATRARLELSLPHSGESAIMEVPGIEPTSPGSNRFVFSTQDILDLSAKVPPGAPIWVSAEVMDSNGCFTYTDKVQEEIELPSCCLTISGGSLYDMGTWIDFPIQERCLAQRLVIHTIAWEQGNENGGRPEAVKRIYWNGDSVARGGSSADRKALTRPIVFQAYDSGNMNVEFSKDSTLNSFSFEVFYTIESFAGVTEGSCVFTEEILD